MKIAILGAGALGSVVGAHLFRTGLDVSLVDRNRAHLAAINAKGLRVDWDGGTQTLPIPATTPEALGRVDLLVQLTKTYDTAAALQSVAPVIAAGACVLTLQNGLGNVDRIAAEVPRARILYGCTMTPADFLAPGHVASHGAAQFPISPVVPGGEADRIGRALAPAGFEMTDRAPVLVWEKAAFNCAMNATAMLGEGTVGDLAAHLGPELPSLIAAETVALARAEGVAARLEAVEEQIRSALANHRAHKPSMLQDHLAGRPTEIDALNGFVARRGRDHALDVRLNRLLAALVAMKGGAS